jgi:hypothetical protein
MTLFPKPQDHIKKGKPSRYESAASWLSHFLGDRFRTLLKANLLTQQVIL